MQKKVARGVPDQWVRKFQETLVPGALIRVGNVRRYLEDQGGPNIGDTAIRNSLSVLCDYEGKGQFRKRLPGG